jgi:ubiquinone/menaquinone biosynthesis C-methylase UbiE
VPAADRWRQRGSKLAARWRVRRRRSPEAQWFWDHYGLASGQIVSFCESSGLSLSQLEIADVGCGDGIMALGLYNRVAPRKLVGFDVVPTNVEGLLAKARGQGAAETLPPGLEFRQSGATSMPAGDGEFSFVYSWSAFEHIADPLGVLREIRRILRPDGHFFLQLWPFYHSAKGSHLWDWFTDDFHHLSHDTQEVVAALRASPRHSREWTDYMSHEFEQLNRITVSELQEAVLGAGFEVLRLELLSSPAILPRGLDRYAWTDLGIGGVKLLAVPSAQA